MKKAISKSKKVAILILTLIFSLTISYAQNIELKELWQSEAHLDTPESVFFSEKDQLMYVSCIAGNPTEKNGDGYIAKLNTNGTPLTLKWVKGLNAPKGVNVMDGKLYVTDIDEFVVIDIETAKIESRISVNDALFLNDVACDNVKRCVYISDSRTGIVYKYKKGEVSVYFQDENIKTVNGLYNTKEILYLGSMDLLALHKKDKKVKKLVVDTKQIDGLQGIAEDLFIGTNWSGRIMELKKDSPLKILEDSESKGFKTADFGINRHDSIIYVPTFFGNTIRAYSYSVQN